MHGAYYLLYISPLWLTFVVLYFLCIGAILIGRQIFEGRPYNVSFASEYGDVALIACIMIGATILQHQHISSGWFWGWKFHFVAGFLSVAAGFVSNDMLNSEEIVDIYHNLIVLPVLSYLLMAVVPVNLVYGRWLVERPATVLLIAAWIIFLECDIRTGRLNQKKWLADHQK